MKNYKICVINVILISSIFAFSCNKSETSLNSENLRKFSVHLKSRNSQNAFTNEEYDVMLNTAAVSLIEVAFDRIHSNKVYIAAKKECDGDNNVLLKYINRSINQSFKENIITSTNNSISKISYDENISLKFNRLDREIDLTLEQFNEIIDGVPLGSKTYYIQIYIPFIDNFTSQELPSAIAVASTDTETLLGYELQSSSFIKTIEVDENYARNNLVWVVSMNETIDNEDVFSDYLDCQSGNSNSIFDINEGGETDTLVPRTQVTIEYYLDSIYIKQDLEKWWGGKQDIAWLFTTYPENGFSYYDMYATTVFKTKKLNEWIYVPGYKSRMTLSSPIYRGDVCDWIIYEADAPIERNEQIFYPKLNPCLNTNFQGYYYSRENEFFHRTFQPCSRYYSELNYQYYTRKRDKKWMYNGYAGYVITSSARSDIY
ncbi:MAG TPA: hypothetical protein DEP28_08655 [Bacteroidetes bacterium]|nr:hypothetical protein [Bacteroidota bacterium]